MDKRTRKLLEKQEPEVLMALIESFQKENVELRQTIRTIEESKALSAQESLNIEEKVKLLRKDMFGRSKEDRLDANDRPRDKSLQDAGLFSRAAFPSPEDRRSKKPADNPLKEIVIEHEATSEELYLESQLRGIESPSENQWKKLEGVVDRCTKIQIVERSYVKEIHQRCKYKLKPEFNDSEKDIIITANGPDSLLPGMNYTTVFVSSVVSDKYIYHLPLERQTRKMESLGLIGMRTSTITRFCALGASSLEPLQSEILKELKSSDLALHLDETPWKIQNKDQKNGYMWIISNRYGSYYFFKPTRSGRVIKERLEGYHGPVMTDGFSGYSALDLDENDDFDFGVTQSYCWAHARRNFTKLEGHDPSVKPILDDIDLLFKIERDVKDFDHLMELRSKYSRLTAMNLFHQLQKALSEARAGSQKKKAIEYLLKRWDGFIRFLEDHRVPLSNNEAERTIRHVVIINLSWRKSFLLIIFLWQRLIAVICITIVIERG